MHWTIGMGGAGSGAPFHMHDLAVNVVLKVNKCTVELFCLFMNVDFLYG